MPKGDQTLKTAKNGLEGTFSKKHCTVPYSILPVADKKPYDLWLQEVEGNRIGAIDLSGYSYVESGYFRSDFLLSSKLQVGFVSEFLNKPKSAGFQLTSRIEF